MRAMLTGLLLASAPSCPDLFSLASHGFTAPTLAAKDASASTAPAGLLVSVTVSAHNPNPFPLHVSSVDYDLTVSGQPAFSGVLPGLSVAESGDSQLAAFGTIARSSPIFQKLAPGQTVPYALTGTAHVDSPVGVAVDVEFTSAGTFVVPGTL